LNQELNERVQACDSLEGEIEFLRKELEKANTQMSFNHKFSKGIEDLNEILEAQ